MKVLGRCWLGDCLFFSFWPKNNERPIKSLGLVFGIAVEIFVRALPPDI